MKIQLTLTAEQVAILHNNMNYAYLFNKLQDNKSPTYKELANLIDKANGVLNGGWDNNGSLKFIR